LDKTFHTGENVAIPCRR